MAEATTAQRTAGGRRKAWGRLRKFPSKRWQARYPAPDGKFLSARTEDDRPLTFLTKSDARHWLNRVRIPTPVRSGRRPRRPWPGANARRPRPPQAT